jgi:hypothetical protein
MTPRPVKDIPQWVPAAVMEEAARMCFNSVQQFMKTFPAERMSKLAPNVRPLPFRVFEIFSDIMPLTLRLLTDPQMKEVWRILERYRPSEEAAHIWRKQYPGCDDNQAIALRVFFSHAVNFAAGKVQVETLSKQNEVRQRWREIANQLAEIADYTLRHWPDDPDDRGADDPDAPPAALKQAAVMMEQARKYQDMARVPGPAHASLVDRDQGDRVARGYALELANLTYSLFGKPLYGTIAKVTNIAFDTNKVSKKNVENWVRLSELPKSSKWLLLPVPVKA